MDVGLLHGIFTIMLMVAFLALVFWTYGKRQKKVFEQAAYLVFDESNDPQQKERNGDLIQ